MKAADLNQAFHDHFSEEELSQCFSIRGYKLTPKGEQALKDHQAIIDRHPKKIFNQPILVDFFVIF